MTKIKIKMIKEASFIKITITSKNIETFLLKEIGKYLIIKTKIFKTNLFNFQK